MFFKHAKRVAILILFMGRLPLYGLYIPILGTYKPIKTMFKEQILESDGKMNCYFIQDLRDS